MQYSINKLDSSAGVGSVLTGKQMKAYGREALGTWLEEHKKAVEMACERMPLQQNPKNKEMKANLELYRNTKRRLDDEMKIWDEVEGSVKRRAVGHDSTSNKSAKSALSASDKAILKEAAAVVKDLESSISDEVEDIQIGVEKLEEFVTGNSLQLKAAEKHARDLKGDLGKDAFSDFPFIGSSPFIPNPMACSHCRHIVFVPLRLCLSVSP